VKKLLLLIPTLDRSGAEKQFTLLATGLPKDEFDVHVVALTRGGPYEKVLREAGIPVTILNKRMRCDPLAWWQLRSEIRDFDPDIVHSWLFAANAYGRTAAGKSPETKLVISERCVDSWKSGWQLKVDRWLAARTSCLVANSQAVAEFYREQEFPPERMLVIPNGVEIPPEEGHGSKDERDRLLAEFDLPAGAKLVGFIGRLAKQKRVDDLLWAMQLLKQLTPNVYLLVIGDGPERDTLRQRAIDVDCEKVVRFADHREDTARILSQLQVVWLASDFEGMSNSLMEAMAASVPVVASDIAPNRELIVDGETGHLVPVGDTAGFAGLTDRLLEDRDKLHAMGEAGRERMQQEFSVETMVQSHVDLYRDLVGTSK
jgi:glycosyltransferase involved in cell wall biosynthesis